VPKAIAKESNFSLIIMLFSGVYLQISGRLFIAELMFIFIFLGLLFNGTLRFHIKRLRIQIVVYLLLVVIFAQIVSDSVRNSDILYFSKGFLLVFFTIINIIVIAKLVNFKLSRYLVVVILYSISSVTSYIIQPQIFEGANPWKFGLGYPFTAVFFCALTYKTKVKPFTILSLCLILGFIDFLLGARNLALVTILAGAISAASRTNALKSLSNETLVDQQPKIPVKSKRSGPGLIMLVLILGLVIFFAYKSAVSSGILGEEAAQKYAQQTSTGTNILFTSRSEVFGQYIAIKDSPLIGHGSYAPLTPEIREKLLPWLLEKRLHTNLIQLESGINYAIPVHSGIFGFWVWFGILSVPFFIYTLYLAISAVRSRNSPPIICYFSLLICWDVFFSPFGMYARMQYPISLIGMLFFSDQKEVGLNDSKTT